MRAPAMDVVGVREVAVVVAYRFARARRRVL